MLLLIPLLPFLGFLLNASFGRRVSKAAAGAVACGAMLGSFAGVGCVAVWRLVGAARPRRARSSQRVFTWITSGDFTAAFTLRLDPLSAVMILVVTGIGSLIHIYSTAYMHEETRLRVRALLLVPEPVRRVHARARARRELPGDVRRLGGRRPLLVPADRLLVPEEVGVRRRQEGVHRQPHRRLRVRARRAAASSSASARSTSRRSRAPRPRSAPRRPSAPCR